MTTGSTSPVPRRSTPAARQDVRFEPSTHPTPIYQANFRRSTLAVLLLSREHRDAAWWATRDRVWQRDLWLDVTRRVPQSHVAAPASLAAWCTWMRVEDQLALAAANRALAASPQYTMAKLIVAGLKSQLAVRDILKNWSTGTIGRAAATTQHS